MMKRLFDFSAALVGLILTSPVMAVIAIIIRATSPGPALFIQTRVGRNEVPFRCYKFRTMATGTPMSPPIMHPPPGSPRSAAGCAPTSSMNCRNSSMSFLEK